MKTMTHTVRFILLATLISVTAACGNNSADVEKSNNNADAAKSEEEAHGHSHD